MKWAARFTDDWQRDAHRGYSFAEWGLAAYATRAECESEWPRTETRYSRELGGWMPTLAGLSVAGTGETADEAREQALASSYAQYPYRFLVVFAAAITSLGSDGELVARPLAGHRAIIERRE